MAWTLVDAVSMFAVCQTLVRLVKERTTIA
jgi:hypothetical protein